MAVFTSAKSAQYVQILLLGHKQMSGTPRTSNFRGAAYLSLFGRLAEIPQDAAAPPHDNIITFVGRASDL